MGTYLIAEIVDAGNVVRCCQIDSEKGWSENGVLTGVQHNYYVCYRRKYVCLGAKFVLSRMQSLPSTHG